MSSIFESNQYIKSVFSETTRLIELKVRMKTPYDKLAKIYIYKNSFHMTRMVATRIHGKKKTFKILCFLLKTNSSFSVFMFNPYKPSVLLWDIGKQCKTKSDAAKRGV